MRKKIVAGNWKMNLKFDEACSLATEIKGMYESEIHSGVSLILCPPSTYIRSISQLLGDHKSISVGGQNSSEQSMGAFTGELAAEMLISVGAEYVILGHSERRTLFGETDECISNKIRRAIDAGLTVIFCVGEPLNIREEGSYLEFISKQLHIGLSKISKNEAHRIILAYEPVWAIGTGKTATAAQAQEVHQFIRQEWAQIMGAEAAETISILYGGSCKPSNAKELFECKDVDGGLIGGAALKSREFIDIAKSF